MLPVLMAAVPGIEGLMIMHVAQRYGLTEDQTMLLAAIRKTENGGTGLEFGIGQDIPGHRAKRYWYSPVRSFITQAKWAAGTIKKRYTGDMQAFARRYCPKNAIVWQTNVEWWVLKQKERYAFCKSQVCSGL